MITDKWGAVNRTPMFFGVCFLVALISRVAPDVHIFLAPMVAAIFFRGAFRIIVPVGVILLVLFFSHTSLIVAERYPGGGTSLYQTAGGWLKADSAMGLAPGDLVIGSFRRENFSPNDDDPFDTGYRVPDGDVTVVAVPFVSSVLTWRERAAEHLHLASGLRLRLVQGMLLGDRAFIRHETRDTFVTTGTAHLLAVSGMHVGLLVGFLLLVLWFLPWKLRIITAGLIIPWYLPVAGFSDTVIRAVLFAVISFGVTAADRSVNYRRFTLWLAGMFLLVGPGALTDISLILSFFAVYGIVTLLQFEESRWRSMLLVGVAASAFTLPVSLAVFGTFNALGVVNTLVLLPFVQLILVFGIGALLAPSVFITPLGVVEAGMMHTLAFLHDVTGPFFVLERISLGFMLVLLVFLGGIAATRWRWAAVAVFIVPFLPSGDITGAWFPAMQRGRGFISVEADGTSSIYFRGTHGQFVYDMVPFAARLGLKSFDRGHIRVYDAPNVFLSVKDVVGVNEPIGGVCVNGQGEGCVIGYWTGASYLPDEDSRADTPHVLWRADHDAGDGIVELGETGPVHIINGSVERLK